MDKIDEWMNRAFDGKVEPIKVQPKTPQSPKQENFPRQHPVTPKGNFRKQFKPGFPQQRQPQGPHQQGPKPRPMPNQPRRPMPVQQVKSMQQPRPLPQKPMLQHKPLLQKSLPQQKPVFQQRPLPHAKQMPQRKPLPQPRRPMAPNKPAPKPRPTQTQQDPMLQKQYQMRQSKPIPVSRGGLKSIKIQAKPEKRANIIKGKLKIIPLGGLNEVGKNMMAYEYEEDIIVVDMGLEFPNDDMLGIDYVIPDVTYLEENRRRIKGIVITHGHLDHIGGIPYILPKLNFPPVYATKLTCGLIQKRLEEFKQEKMASVRLIDPDKPLRIGKFFLNFFRVAHSIPDSVGIVIDTPEGKIVHTGDFKFDDSPAGLQKKQDIEKIKALGNQNVLALFSDSTNALKPGHTMSETAVGQTLENLIKKTKGRIIIASFSTLIGRLQQIIEYAQKYNRKIFISGRSMKENIDIAVQLGYLKFPGGIIQEIKKYAKNPSPDSQTLILTTGSQGESVSALTRIASNEHPNIQIKKGDTVILSSSPIIGNERAIFSVVNKLCLLGADVIHNQIMDVHTSGHGYQDELIQMIRMVRPKYFIPVHGEYFMRQTHGNLAKEFCGMPEGNVIMLQNGDILVAEKGKMYKSTETIDTKYILIDGLGEGHVGSQVQIDRQIMSQNGALVILIHVNKKKGLSKIPDVVSRGFVYMHETDEVTMQIANVAGEAFKAIRKKNPGANRQDVKAYVKQTVDKFTHNNLERRPLIVPLIIED